jgi:translocation and assembly module TamB
VSGPAPGDAPLRPDPARRRRRFGLWGWLGVLTLIVVPAALIAVVWWAVASASGTAWLLAQLPRLQLVEPQGSLLGDFSARQMTVTLSDTDRIVIDQPRWQGLRVRSTADPDTWVAIRAKALSAERVAISLTPSGEPFKLPQHLRLPFTLRIDDVRIAELRLPNPAVPPLYDLQGRVHLGQGGGKQHRVDELSLRLDPMLLQGHAQIGAEAPMALDVQLSARQDPNRAPPSLPDWAQRLRADWQAELSARGPLVRFSASAHLRAQGQELDAEGVIAPADAWPLPQLEATTRGLDLSALLAHAPATDLSGSLSIVPLSSVNEPPKAGGAAARGGALSARGTLSNAQAGRLQTKRLPIRRVVFDVRGQANRPDHFEVAGVEVQFATGMRDAGQVKGQGTWTAGRFALTATLSRLQPQVIDPRLPAMTLSGPIRLEGSVADASRQLGTELRARAELSGRLDAAAREVQVRVDTNATPERIDVKEFRASAGGAQATLTGTALRQTDAWQLKGEAVLSEFDPQPWLPGLPGSAWARGPHRLNAKGNWSLQVPDSLNSGTTGARRTRVDGLAALRGQAELRLNDSVLAGVPLSGQLRLDHPSPATPLAVTAQLDAAGNQLRLDASLAASSARAADDRWTLSARAPQLGRIAPLLTLVPGLEGSGLLDGFSGALDADARLSGRWPELTLQGQAQSPTLRGGPLLLNNTQARWHAGTRLDAPLDLLAEVADLRWNGQRIDATRLQVQGRAREHSISLQSELRATPPAWVDALQGTPGASRVGTSHTLARVTARGALDGGLFDAAAGAAQPDPWSWQGVLQLIELRGSQANALPWFRTRDVALSARSGAAAGVTLGAGRAELLDAAMRWNRIAWQSGHGVQTQQIDVQAELEPLAVVPLLRRVQPDFGWSGDLQMGGRIVVHQAESFSADIVLERTRGDLRVTDEAGTTPLGLTDLRIGLNAQDGVWSFTQGLAGQQLGQAAGAVVVRTSPRLAWPEPTAPMQGVVEAQVANLGTWSAWVPPGWRLGGRLGVTASIGGQFGAPAYTGSMRGSGIAIRNLLLGVDVNSGELDINLEGETARIRTFSAKAGPGRVELSGSASFGAHPRAQLALMADRFQVLGRVDRRVVASGEAKLALDRDSGSLTGKFAVDQGLFDFSRGDAPSLGNDVVVVNRKGQDAEPPPASANRWRKMQLDLLVNLGENLRVRGRGIDTALKGELRITNPNGRLAMNGSVRTEDGTYAAYGQKLEVDRGVITFNGPPENPRLDIEATRPNLDVRVGVQIGGTAQNPRVRLFSSTDMTDTERLSWLLLGRGSEGLGTGDTALLQRAALALLAGEGEGVTDQITKAIGIDEVSVGQKEGAGEVRETVITLGKQLSRRWYVGYERSLTETTGTWQLIYRIAQRFTLRAQSGLDNSLDLIWSWRWD